MGEVVEQLRCAGHVVKIIRDEDCESPRVAYDNLGKMICFHRRYDLGDKHEFASPEDIDLSKYAVVLPLYLYDHSGLSMSTSNATYPFNDRWDAGQVGYIVATPEDIKDCFGDLEDETLEKVRSNLMGEVATYDQFLNAQVYGYVIENEQDDEVIDSCWGFYGSDVMENGMIDHFPEKIAAAVRNKKVAAG